MTMPGNNSGSVVIRSSSQRPRNLGAHQNPGSEQGQHHHDAGAAETEQDAVLDRIGDLRESAAP